MVINFFWVGFGTVTDNTDSQTPTDIMAVLYLRINTVFISLTFFPVRT